MNGNILVDIGNEGEFVGISTYECKHGSRGRFLISWQTILTAMTGTERRITFDFDCGNFAELWREGEFLLIRFTWLSEYAGCRVQGYKQLIRIPKTLLLSMLTRKCRRKYLSQPEPRQAKIDATGVSSTIRLIVKDKLTRRAFTKAMRDLFHWPGDEVKLYKDGAYNFYFTTKSGFPKCGGLILHESGRSEHPYIYYSIHT